MILLGEERIMLRHTTDEKATKSEPAEPTNLNPDHDTVAALAYQLWTLRARPIGSPEVDWFRAEDELRKSQLRVWHHSI